jgi:hypothetical protein
MSTTITGFLGLVLNVWSPNDNDSNDLEDWEWKFALYPYTAQGIETSAYLSLEPSPDQIQRYLELTSDSDWWVGDDDAHYSYILWGTRA